MTEKGLEKRFRRCRSGFAISGRRLLASDVPRYLVDDGEPRRGGVFKMQIVLNYASQSICMQCSMKMRTARWRMENKRANTPYLQTQHMSDVWRFLLGKKKVGCLLSIYAIGGRAVILRNRPVLDPRSMQPTHLAHLAFNVRC